MNQTQRKKPTRYGTFDADINTMPPPPRDALCIIGAQYFKIGHRGWVFRWSGTEWLRCQTVTVEHVRRAKPLPTQRKTTRKWVEL